MSGISVIILTYNEQLHLERCIKNILPIAQDIFVVDSYSTDNTVEIATSFGAKVFQKKWENNHAKQFNWALDNLPIKTEWILRIDADEYLTPELINELNYKVKLLPPNITGVFFKRRHIFLEKWIKYGFYPTKILRLFRFKKANYRERWMDEEIQIFEGITQEFKYDFVDHNLQNFAWWIAKHNNYSTREAIDQIFDELTQGINKNLDASNREIKKKSLYSVQPLFFRASVYFVYRYFFKFGFLEGRRGFLWHFFQAFWYRTLVDVKIYEMKRNCKNVEELKEFILIQYNITL
ncbi:MAG: glycosyltransferase family 2 protein [Bacteroidales bacterium]|nr:glycosyltransferase family 2 protein [Bacteroidales bacterium]